MQVIQKARLKRFFRQDTTNTAVPLAVGVASIVLIAGYLLVSTHASGFFAAVESDGGTVSGNASVISDSSASGGKALAFNAPASSGGGGNTSGCPLPAYPAPSCTGVPAGTTFTRTVSGDYTVTTAGTVIDGWHITGDLSIKTSNVTIKNSQIDGSVDDEVGDAMYGPFTITDSTVGPASGCSYQGAGVGQVRYTATRVLVRNWTTSFQTSNVGNVTIRDSFAKICGVGPDILPPDGSHSDPFQAYCPEAPTVTCDNVVLDHNTFDDRNPYVTAPIFGNQGPGNGYGSTTTITNNLLIGGTFTMRYSWRTGPPLIFKNNAIVDKLWTYGPVDTEGSCSGMDWSGNTLVNIDTNYAVTKTVGTQSCVD